MRTLVIIAALVGRSLAEEVAITNENFASVVTESGKPWVIEFYSEMCGSCKEFAPTWHAFADKVSARARVLSRANGRANETGSEVEEDESEGSSRRRIKSPYVVFRPTQLVNVDGLGVGRVCVDKPPGVKLASRCARAARGSADARI